MDLMSYKEDTEKESQGLLEQVKAESEKTVRAFRQLHQFLEEQENLLLNQMEEVIVEIQREKENHLDKLEKELQSLDSAMQEVHNKLLQPTADLLKGVEHYEKRCEVLKNCENSSIIFPDALKWTLCDICDINPFLEGIRKQFQDSLLSGLQLKKAHVHLVPERVHAELIIVSEDWKSVRWTATPQDAPVNLERSRSCFVLGQEEFTAGRHFWEVTVGDAREWSLGVAKKSMKGKKEIKGGPKGGMWDIGKWANTYLSYTDACYTPLSLTQEPRKIRVILNYEGGRVAFYDADRGTLICEYLGAPFAKETLCPICYLYGNGHLALSS